MRLIDADEVKKAFIGNRYGTKAIEYVIDDAPTVKAIPIEWLKAKAESWADRDVLMWHKCVLLLIEEWEKENEID